MITNFEYILSYLIMKIEKDPIPHSTLDLSKFC